MPNSDVPLAGPSSKVAYENTYTINCNDNYQFSNGQTQIQITCRANGTFDITPVCEGECFISFLFSLTLNITALSKCNCCF